jgi:hypothetical protein
MSFGRRGGERRLARATNARAPGADTKNRACAQETRPSLGPKTRTRQSSLCIGRKFDGGALAAISRLGKPAQAGGINTGITESGRSAARRVSSLSQERQHGTSEKEGGRGLRPNEDQEPGFGCSHVVVCCRSRQANVWSRISSANALQKERSGSSEQGPSAATPPVGETAGGSQSERALAASNSLVQTG